MSDTAVDKVEEVNLDDIEDEPAHDAKAKLPPATDTAPGAAGSTTVEEVRPEELAQAVPLPELETNHWLLLGPLLLALVVMWNVDWKDLRVQRELAARRDLKWTQPRKPR